MYSFTAARIRFNNAGEERRSLENQNKVEEEAYLVSPNSQALALRRLYYKYTWKQTGHLTPKDEHSNDQLKNSSHLKLNYAQIALK